MKKVTFFIKEHMNHMEPFRCVIGAESPMSGQRAFEEQPTSLADESDPYQTLAKLLNFSRFSKRERERERKASNGRHYNGQYALCSQRATEAH